MADNWQAQVGPMVVAAVNNIATSQTPLTAGNLTLTAGVIAGTTPDIARRVLFTPAGAEATNTTIWTVYGNNRSGNAITETVNGVNNPATVSTVNDFASITRIAVNKAQAGAVTVGTSGVASSPWFLVNRHTTPINIGVCVVPSGTVNYTVEYTYDNLDNAYTTGTFPTVFSFGPMASLTANADGVFALPVHAVRVTINSNTNPAYVRVIALQAGLGGGN